MSELRKVVINVRHGGFGLSHDAFLRLREIGNAHAIAEPDWGEFYPDGSGPRGTLEKVGGGTMDTRSMDSFCSDIKRDDPDLIRVVEEMGEQADGRFSRLGIVEIPADVKWIVEEYDGAEWVAEVHRQWHWSSES